MTGPYESFMSQVLETNRETPLDKHIVDSAFIENPSGEMVFCLI
jgi:hypothetical protein